LWTQLAERGRLRLSDKQLDLLSRYLDLLLEANLTMNLTSAQGARRGGGAARRRCPDAAAVSNRREKSSIADIGSGGGSPAIPLAIARSDASVTCIESTGKKATFLTAAAALSPANVAVVAERAEQLRRTFDVVTARAIGALAKVVEFGLPLVKPGGRLLAMKGPKVVDEMGEAAPMIRRFYGGKPVIHAIELPGIDGHVVVEIGRRVK
jgi:16S rRNA (guanine527-N7)-methyltransferase